MSQVSVQKSGNRHHWPVADLPEAQRGLATIMSAQGYFVLNPCNATTLSHVDTGYQKGCCSRPCCIHPKLLTTKFVPLIMFHMLSELPLLNKVGADIVLEYGNINSFLNLFNPNSQL